jgi:hypothetical protein
VLVQGPVEWRGCLPQDMQTPSPLVSERPPHVDEVSANFGGYRVSAQGTTTAVRYPRALQISLARRTLSAGRDAVLHENRQGVRCVPKRRASSAFPEQACLHGCGGAACHQREHTKITTAWQCAWTFAHSESTHRDERSDTFKSCRLRARTRTPAALALALEPMHCRISVRGAALERTRRESRRIVRSEALLEVNITIIVFWDLQPCRLVGMSQHIEG